MKQPSKPTRAQKVIISAHKLRPENWMVVYESKDTLEVIGKKTSMRKVLQKYEDKENNTYGSYTNGCRFFTGTEQECRDQYIHLERYMHATA